MPCASSSSSSSNPFLPCSFTQPIGSPLCEVPTPRSRTKIIGRGRLDAMYALRLLHQWQAEVSRQGRHELVPGLVRVAGGPLKAVKQLPQVRVEGGNRSRSCGSSSTRGSPKKARGSCRALCAGTTVAAISRWLSLARSPPPPPLSPWLACHRRSGTTASTMTTPRARLQACPSAVRCWRGEAAASAARPASRRGAAAPCTCRAASPPQACAAATWWW